MQLEHEDDDEVSSFAEALSSSNKVVPLSFPQQLMDVLSDEKLSDVISWLPHGQGWIILDKQRFAEEVLPNYFEKKSKWTSFTRKLNRWNFTRVTRGDEVGSYYHPLFQRGKTELCMQMTCMGSKTTQSMEPLNPVALGLATPKMIEQGLLSGMTTTQGGIQNRRNAASVDRSSMHNSYLSQWTHPIAGTISPQQLSQFGLQNVPLASSVPSSQHASPIFPVAHQPRLFGPIGQPQCLGGLSRLYDDMSTHVRRPTSPNPLPFNTNLQPTQVSSFNWTQSDPTRLSQLYTNEAEQQHIMSHVVGSHQNDPSAVDDALTLTPTPSKRYAFRPGISQHNRLHDAGSSALTQEDFGEDISPSIFDTTSSSSDQGSGAHPRPVSTTTQTRKSRGYRSPTPGSRQMVEQDHAISSNLSFQANFMSPRMILDRKGGIQNVIGVPAPTSNMAQNSLTRNNQVVDGGQEAEGEKDERARLWRTSNDKV